MGRSTVKAAVADLLSASGAKAGAALSVHVAGGVHVYHFGGHPPAPPELQEVLALLRSLDGEQLRKVSQYAADIKELRS